MVQLNVSPSGSTIFIESKDKPNETSFELLDGDSSEIDGGLLTGSDSVVNQ